MAWDKRDGTGASGDGEGGGRGSGGGGGFGPPPGESGGFGPPPGGYGGADGSGGSQGAGPGYGYGAPGGPYGGGPGGYGYGGGGYGQGPGGYGQGSGGGFGDGGEGSGYGAPPPIQLPTVTPGPPPPPRGPADPLRATAVALLNLSGLGIGYALLRRWFALAVCLVATGLLLLLALPADPDGVAPGVLAGYAAVLVVAAVHGAIRALRSPLAWPPQAPVAALLGLVLLAVPVSGAYLYDGARDEATQQALLDRLHDADTLVQKAKNQPFTSVKADYAKALDTYGDIDGGHRDSRAGKLVPDRLDAYYRAVGAPYDDKKYCDAIDPLKYLRNVPDTIDEKTLGALADWPDERLATSLYECGAADIGVDAHAEPKNGDLAELLTTFPESGQAAKVEPAFKAAIDDAAGDVKGDDPCAAATRLRTLDAQASALADDAGDGKGALNDDAGSARGKVPGGTYACGVDEFKKKDFESALDTLNGFVKDYGKDKNAASAKRIAIAAEVAQAVPGAGEHLPSADKGGSIPVTIENDSPDTIEVLYTGPVTGKLTLKPCGSCSHYSGEAEAALDACKDSGKHYPSKTLHLPVGTTYFLHKPTSGSAGSDTAKIESGYTYTECAYVVQGYGSGGDGSGDGYDS
ncbi:hypothetical protein [Streptomyces sp. NPDC050560]|uniref:hypothetical protein n=1 Tax=Streptomyces sp. NPDC050560 TaxID=3365630 RepID=UPI0037A7953F